MERTDEAFLVCATSEVHHHGFVRLLVMVVWGRVVSELAYTSFHRGSNGEHLPVLQDTIGVVEETD
jgi:hypothetical protein